MILVLSIDVVVIGCLVAIALTKGLERTLPFAAFALVLLPIQSYVPIPGLPDVTTSRLVIITLALLYVVFGRAQSTTRSAGRPALAILILADLAWLALSAANSVVPLVSFKAWLSQALDFFLIYYLFYKVVSSPDTVRRILVGVVSAMAVCSVLGYFEAYHGWTVMQYFPATINVLGGSSQNAYVDMARGLRIRTTFPHPILYGAALAFAVPLTLYLVKTARSRAGKTFLWASLMLMFMNIFKTGSRGPWVALIVSMALLLIFSRSEARKYIVWLALLSAFVMIVRPGVWDSIKGDYEATLNPDSPEGKSYQYRYEILHLATRTINKDVGRALWGYGPGTFFDLHLQGVHPDTGNSFTYITCDSTVAELMIETGYVGLLLAILMLLKMAKIAFSAYRSLPPPYDELSLSFFIVIAAFCFMMTSVAIYGWGQQSYMLWIVFALADALPKLLPAGETVSREPQATAFELVAAVHTR